MNGLNGQLAPDWLRDKKINVLVLTALEQSAEFPGVPAVVDLVNNQEDRQLFEVMVSRRERSIVPMKWELLDGDAPHWRRWGAQWGARL